MRYFFFKKLHSVTLKVLSVFLIMSVYMHMAINKRPYGVVVYFTL